MSNQTTNQRFVVIVNRNRSVPEMLNAVGHLALGLGHHPHAKEAEYSQFTNPLADSVSYLTDYPLIILGAKSSQQIYNLHQSLLNTSIFCNVFFENMFSQDVSEQLHQVASTNLSELNYVAIMLYGKTDELNPFTKKFSLLRSLSA